MLLPRPPQHCPHTSSRERALIVRLPWASVLAAALSGGRARCATADALPGRCDGPTDQSFGFCSVDCRVADLSRLGSAPFNSLHASIRRRRHDTPPCRDQHAARRCCTVRRRCCRRVALEARKRRTSWLAAPPCRQQLPPPTPSRTRRQRRRRSAARAVSTARAAEARASRALRWLGLLSPAAAAAAALVLSQAPILPTLRHAPSQQRQQWPPWLRPPDTLRAPASQEARRRRRRGFLRLWAMAQQPPAPSRPHLAALLWRTARTRMSRVPPPPPPPPPPRAPLRTAMTSPWAAGAMPSLLPPPLLLLPAPPLLMRTAAEGS